MNGSELLENLTELDSDVINNELPKKKARPHRTLRWIAAAACLLIVFCSVTAYAEVRKMEARRLRTVTESGFTLRVDLEKVNEKKLKGLADVPDIITEQIANYKPQPSWSSLYIDPCRVIETYPSIEKAIGRIGYDKICVPELPPLSYTMPALDSFYIPGMKRYDGSAAVLTVQGDRDGNVLSVLISLDDVNSSNDSIELQTRIQLITGNYPDKDLKVTSVWPAERGWNTEIEHRTTENGLDFELVKINGVDNDRREGLEGYVAKDSVLYSLHLSYELGNADRAMEIMLAWADSIG